MNVHAPERRPDESMEAYRHRRAASRRIASQPLGFTRSEDYQPPKKAASRRDRIRAGLQPKNRFGGHWSAA